MRTWQRTVAGALVAIVGVAFIVVVVIDRLFSAGPAFDRMSDGFRPIMKPAAIARVQTDLAGVQAFATEYQTKAVPLLAKAMGMTQQRYAEMMTVAYPQVAKGLQTIPAMTQQFSGVLATLKAERARFAQADAIPTASLPAATVPWALLVVGIVALGLGIAIMLTPGRAVPVVALIVGVALVVVPLALSLVSKAGAADTMNRHLKPVYTAQMVAGAKQSLATMTAMGVQVQRDLLPTIGQQAGIGADPAAVQAFLKANLPVMATALATMPQTLARFGSLVGTFDRHLSDFDTLKPVWFAPVVTVMIIGGIVALIGGAWALVPARRREPAIVTEERRHLRAA